VIPAAATPTSTPGSTNLWSRFLAMPQCQSPAFFASVLSSARLAGIENDQAIIRFPLTHETFVKQWSNNGKRDLIANALTELRGQPTGVRLEIDETATQSQSAAPAAAAPAPRPATTDAGPVVEFVLQEFGGELTRVE
jgi:hypothetical protein